MEAYNPHSFPQPKLSEPWFNPAFSRAIHDREVAHKRYGNLQTFPKPTAYPRQERKNSHWLPHVPLSSSSSSSASTDAVTALLFSFPMSAK
ncbi:hypothetical protein E2C01_036525 [Portunus trituberculatus]|uniref:Uncharacterized protein n=1 Tax=Portunus trituberculatus TaxID=210409 RepID=A0A5B7FCP7_PORTR|nr:hypothetical protein [Portunus trituberculatus]